MKEKTIEDAFDIYYVRSEEDEIVDNEEQNVYSRKNIEENGNDVSNERQEFIESTRTELMIRAGLRCSNPYCRKITIAYDPEVGSLVSIGEGAHIIAAKKGGPRYPKNEEHKKNEIKNINNGIWLCRNCHSMIDKKCNESKYTVELLHEWKEKAEGVYINQISKPRLDWINSLKEDIIGECNFKLEEATTLQIALICFCMENNQDIEYSRECVYLGDEIDDDYFGEFYKKFYNWITSGKCIKVKKMLGINLFDPLKLHKETYMYFKSLFNDSITSQNMHNMADITEKYITLSNKKIYDYLFDSNIDKVEAFLNSLLIN